MWGYMRNNKEQSLMKLSKKRLSVIDIVTLYRILLDFPSDNITLLKMFLDNYYGIESMPVDFYKMFLYCIHSNRFKVLFDILLKRNIYDLINFLNNNGEISIELDDSINPSDYFNIPHKYIVLIVGFIKNLDLCNDEIPLKQYIANSMQWLLRRTCINTENEINKIAIKMFLSIGLSNSIDLLSKKYGLVDYDIIYFLFNNINVKKNNDRNNSIFQEFLFGNKKDSNNNMRLMLAGQLNELFVNFDYFYNAIDYFIDKLGSKLNRSKLLILLKERYVSPRLENPELTGDILQDMISSYYNRYGISDKESEIIKKNLHSYNEKLRNKTQSSILKTDIPKIGDYTFEMLPLTDARNLVMGYRAGNCFRINGDAFVLFNNYLTNPHMRLISISTDECKDFGMILLMRNGNVLIAQGIETSKRAPEKILGEKLYLAVQSACEYVMKKMNEEDDEIVASIIGLTNNNTALYNHCVLPFIINPILSDNHQYYNGVDSYQGLLAIKEGKTIRDIKLYVPKKLYGEKGNKIWKRDRSLSGSSFDYRMVQKILISLRYARFKKSSNEEMFYYYDNLSKKTEAYTICTYDWFIMVFKDGSIDTFINSDDPVIINEYNQELDKIKGFGIHN